jgi:hypothetical protein
MKWALLLLLVGCGGADMEAAGTTGGAPPAAWDGDGGPCANSTMYFAPDVSCQDQCLADETECVNTTTQSLKSCEATCSRRCTDQYTWTTCEDLCASGCESNQYTACALAEGPCEQLCNECNP